MATPTPPIPPATVERTVAAALRTINIANETQLEQYVNRTDTNLGPGGTASGGPTFGDKVVLAITTFSPVGSEINLPVPLGSSTGIGGDNYVTFTSANLALLPAAGTRVSPSDTVNMPRCNVASFKNGFFWLGDNTHHYRFQGLHLTTAAGVGAGGFLFLQAPSALSSTSVHPHHIIVERCVMHPDLSGTNVGAIIGVGGSGRHMALLDNYIYDIAWCAGQAEEHAVLFSGGIGPYEIRNNYMSSSACGVFIGDSNYENVGVTPADITVTGNFIEKQQKWNGNDVVYQTGTATISSDGRTVTLSPTATAQASWASDGDKYFALDGGGGYPQQAQKITAVNTSTKVLTLNAPYTLSQGLSGLLYRITRWNGFFNSANVKNHFEAKQGKRIAITNNIFGPSFAGNQTIACQLSSARGQGCDTSDLLLDSNTFGPCPIGIGLTFRATDSDSGGMGPVVSATANGATTNITMGGGIDFPDGCTIELITMGTTNLNGRWYGTRVSNTVFSIPVTMTGSYSGGGHIVAYKRGSPLQRVQITNNLFEDMGSYNSGFNGSANASRYAAMQFNSNVALGTPTGGPADATLSTTGNWAPTDFLIEHNTFVSPTGSPDFQNAFINVVQGGIGGGGIPYTDVLGQNIYIRNNVARCYGGGQSIPFLTHQAADTGVNTGGTAGLALWTDSSRSVIKNVWYNPNVSGLANAYSELTGSEAYPSNAFLTAYTDVGFTAYTLSNLAGYALRPMYSTGTCVVTQGLATVTGFTALPANIAKGMIFKNNANGAQYAVLSRDSSTQLTLQTAYVGTSNAGAFTIGFQGWATDGADPGVNTTTLAAAIAGVATGTPSGGGGGGSTTAVLGLTGNRMVMGLGLTPQTP